MQWKSKRQLAWACLTLAVAASGTKAAATAPAHKRSPYRPEKMTNSARMYYESAWGLDDLKVSHTASGNLIRFSYKVLEPRRAAPLGDVRATPFLVGQRSNVVLQIPVMEKVGQLRQVGVAQPGQEYWMVFSNKGNLVKPGDKVNLVIGSFHADGLTVE